MADKDAKKVNQQAKSSFDAEAFSAPIIRRNKKVEPQDLGIPTDLPKTEQPAPKQEQQAWHQKLHQQRQAEETVKNVQKLSRATAEPGLKAQKNNVTDEEMEQHLHQELEQNRNKLNNELNQNNREIEPSAIEQPVEPNKHETKQSAPKEKKVKDRLKSDNVTMEDLETINENNLKKYRSRSMRNKVVIVSLAILLLAAIATIIVILNIKRLQNNCVLNVRGNVDAEFIVDGKKLNKFRSPVGIQGNRVYMIDTDIKINSTGTFNVYFTIEAYRANELMQNTFAYSFNHDLFYQQSNGKYTCIAPITGGQTINLFEGIVLDDAYADSLTTENFRLEVNIYFERA